MINKKGKYIILSTALVFLFGCSSYHNVDKIDFLKKYDDFLFNLGETRYDEVTLDGKTILNGEKEELVSYKDFIIYDEDNDYGYVDKIGEGFSIFFSTSQRFDTYIKIILQTILIKSEMNFFVTDDNIKMVGQQNSDGSEVYLEMIFSKTAYITYLKSYKLTNNNYENYYEIKFSNYKVAN